MLFINNIHITYNLNKCIPIFIYIYLNLILSKLNINKTMYYYNVILM